MLRLLVFFFVLAPVEVTLANRYLPGLLEPIFERWGDEPDLLGVALVVVNVLLVIAAWIGLDRMQGRRTETRIG